MIPAVSLEALVFVFFLLVKQNTKARDGDNTDLAMAEEKGDDWDAVIWQAVFCLLLNHIPDITLIVY